MTLHDDKRAPNRREDRGSRAATEPSEIVADEVLPPSGRSLWTGPHVDPTRYRVDLGEGTLRAVGDGGEGLVFRAFRCIDGVEHQVALKMHTAVPVSDYSRVVARAQILAGVNHPNVMRVVDAFVGSALVDVPADDVGDFSIIYTVAEWIPGIPFHEATATVGPGTGLRWVGQIARAVAFLHSYRSDSAPAGIIHRDIKPSNIRIALDGRAVLIDLGIARPHREGDLTEGAGTYLWRAPEVLGGPGEPGPGSDAWGIGALAYWVLVGEPPRLEGAEASRERLVFAAKDVGVANAHNVGLQIAQLLETHPDHRPSDLVAWADHLDAIVAGLRLKRERSHRALKVGAVGILLVGIAAVLTIWQEGSSNALRPAKYAFGPQSYPSGLTADRTWTLSGSGGDLLSAKVMLINRTSSLLRATYDEVIPISVASKASKVIFQPRPSQVIVADPVVAYDLQLRSGAMSSVTYTVHIGATKGSWLSRLARLARDQTVAQDLYLQTSKQPKPTTLTTLSLTPAQLEMTIGQTLPVTISGMMSDGTPAPMPALSSLAWTSSNTEAATVSNGVVNAVGVGTTTITVQAASLTASMTVSVTGSANSTSEPSEGPTSTTRPPAVPSSTELPEPGSITSTTNLPVPTSTLPIAVPTTTAPSTSTTQGATTPSAPLNPRWIQNSSSSVCPSCMTTPDWDPPATDGGSPISAYFLMLISDPSQPAQWYSWPVDGVGVDDFGNLCAGTPGYTYTYYFLVYAQNSAGLDGPTVESSPLVENCT